MQVVWRKRRDNCGLRSWLVRQMSGLLDRPNQELQGAVRGAACFGTGLVYLAWEEVGIPHKPHLGA